METRQIPISRQRWFGLERIDIPGKPFHSVIARKVRGMLLVERSDFIKYVETEGQVKQLQRAGMLTSYHSNGQVKKRVNGRLPNTKTYYDLKEWINADFNNI